MVTHRPLHRLGRAALPFRAPTSGDNTEAYQGMEVIDADERAPRLMMSRVRCHIRWWVWLPRFRPRHHSDLVRREAVSAE